MGITKGMIDIRCYYIKGGSKVYNDFINHEIIVVDLDKEWVDRVGLTLSNIGDARKVKRK